MTPPMHRAIVEFIQQASRIAKRPSPPDDADSGEVPLPADWMSQPLSYAVRAGELISAKNTSGFPLSILVTPSDPLF